MNLKVSQTKISHPASIVCVSYATVFSDAESEAHGNFSHSNVFELYSASSSVRQSSDKVSC